MAEDVGIHSEKSIEIKEELGKREAAKMMKRRHVEIKNEERLRLRKIRGILRKEVTERKPDDVEYLCRYPNVVNELAKRKEKRRQLIERIKEVT